MYPESSWAKLLTLDCKSNERDDIGSRGQPSLRLVALPAARPIAHHTCAAHAADSGPYRTNRYEVVAVGSAELSDSRHCLVPDELVHPRRHLLQSQKDIFDSPHNSHSWSAGVFPSPVVFEKALKQENWSAVLKR